MTLIRSLCALALLAFVTAGSAAMAEPVFPPGSRIGLEPPPGMALSKRFAGFEDPEHKAAILMLDLPGAAYQEAESSLFATPQKDVEGLTRRAFPFSDGIALLATGTARENGKRLHKWFFLATAVAGPVSNLTAFVTVEVPEDARDVYTDAVVEKALKTITFRKTPLAEQLALLPFALKNLAGFHVRQVMPTGSVILSDKEEGGAFTQAYVIVTVAPGGPASVADRPRFAQDLISSGPVHDLKITSGETMRVKGMPGNEVRASGKDLGDKPVQIVQWLRFGSGGFMRILGVSPAEEWETMFPRFRALRDGIENK
ncbi:MAG TPA: hypothetical protein VN655_14520 [Pseudolabrys sp.]|nr:hypothetical protein [Pseudolabrys sp.]